MRGIIRKQSETNMEGAVQPGRESVGEHSARDETSVAPKRRRVEREEVVVNTGGADDTLDQEKQLQLQQQAIMTLSARLAEIEKRTGSAASEEAPANGTVKFKVRGGDKWVRSPIKGAWR